MYIVFFNSAAKIRALLGSSEFFLINATNADFYSLTCNINSNNLLMQKILRGSNETFCLNLNSLQKKKIEKKYE